MHTNHMSGQPIWQIYKEYMEQEYSFEYSKKLLYDNPKRILEGEKVVQ